MQQAQLKRIIRSLVPVGLIEQKSRRRQVDDEMERELTRRQRFEGLRSVVGEAVAAIGELTEAQRIDANFLENHFLPSLGLNDETLDEQPRELAASFGKGLHIWQYPSQLAAYLVWLAGNAAGITSYMEIGCRWGGMFILISEWLRRSGAPLRGVTAVDPISPTPFIETYFELLHREPTAGALPIETNYLRHLSTSPAVQEAIDRIRPDFVFIDGDHRLRGALADHMLARKHARIIVHHDVCSHACPDTTFLWETLKVLEAREFECFEFVRQYPSVEGNYLGIGAMKRKKIASHLHNGARA